jgi:hypothetical protein
LKPSIPVAILTYGNSKTEKIARQTRLPVVDVTKPNWITQVEDAAYPRPIDECRLQAIGHAAAIARKKIPVTSIEVVITEDKLHTGEQSRKEKEGPAEVAARIENIVISKRYHPAAEDSRIWLSPHHLELIKKLLGDGFKIEILDELNNVVRTIEQ